MHRGTTPTLTFTAPFTVEGATKLSIAFEQASTVLLEKTLADVVIDDKTITLSLTQAETLLFNSSKGVIRMQIRIELSGKVLASNIMQTSADRILKDGVL